MINHDKSMIKHDKHIIETYELQPKFRLMESSIRAAYFLEIELGLGKR